MPELATITIITADGKEWKAAPLSIATMREFRDWCFEYRLSLFRAYAARVKMLPEERMRTMAAVIREPLGPEAIEADELSPPGMIAKVWIAIRALDPKVTYEEIEKAFNDDMPLLTKSAELIDAASFSWIKKEDIQEAAEGPVNPTNLTSPGTGKPSSLPNDST